ncbi:MAG TPA: hypothetical protein VEY88_00745 [Archangium sp.]|nr:hypothetical protein [Archangium sp.]
MLRPPPGASTLTRTPTHEMPLVLAPPPLLKQAVGDENHPAPAEDGSAALSAVTDLDG